MNPPHTDGEKDECPICLCEYSDPVITNCFHKFCNECITKSIYTSGNRCPVCRNEPCQITVRIKNDESSPELELCKEDYLCDRCFVKNFCPGEEEGKEEENGTKNSACLSCSGSNPKRNRVSTNPTQHYVNAYLVQEITPRRRRRPPPDRIATDEARIHYSPGSSPFESGGGGHSVIDMNSVGKRMIRTPEESVFVDDDDDDDDDDYDDGFGVRWMEGEPHLWSVLGRRARALRRL